MSKALEANTGVTHGEGDYPDELVEGAKLLGGQYTILRFLNSGGFGITYLAKDSLDRTVVIKECFPESICRRSVDIVRARSRAHQSSFASIVTLFMQEARSQAKLVHPNIAGVHQVFNDNDTAYMAIDYINGNDLLDRIDSKEKLKPADVEHWLRRVLDAVGFIHADGILHRDISPDNILINEKNEPILIDFGAAREQATKSEKVLSTMRVVKDGYSPQEFYITGSSQTPSSDLYALAATFYHVITGEAPADSQSRLGAIAQNQTDIYTPLHGRIDGYPKLFLSAIDKALQVLPKDRYQSAQEWLDAIDGKSSGKKSALTTPSSNVKTASDAKKKRRVLLPVVAAVTLAGAGVFVMMDDPGKALNEIVLNSDASSEVIPKPEIPQDATNKVAEITSDAAIPSTVSKPPVVISPDTAAVTPIIKPEEPKPTPITAGTPIETTKPTVTSSLLTETEWAVDTPFETSEVSVKEGTFALVTLVRPNIDTEIQTWLKSGSIIYSINGMIVYNNESIARAVSQTTDLEERESATLNLRIRSTKNGPLEDQVLKLPVVRSVKLPNGFQFSAMQNSRGWETRVTRIPSSAVTSLEVGDIIISEAQTNVVMQGAEDIEVAISRLHESSAQSAYFTISRQGKLDSASVDLGAK